MTHQLFLIAPEEGIPSDLAAGLSAILDAAPVSALLLARGERLEDQYRQWASIALPMAQSRGVAVLLDDAPEMVSALGADGVHLSGGIGAVRDAVGMLKPGHIVGAGAIGSRHEAMLRGELEPDYLLFGDRAGADGLELAQWWSGTFEIPCVYLAPSLRDALAARSGAEFLGLRTQEIWGDPKALARMMGEP